MEEVGDKVGKMLNAEASHDQTVEGGMDQVEDEDTSIGLTKKYPW
jgi:hypothetical protein